MTEINLTKEGIKDSVDTEQLSPEIWTGHQYIREVRVIVSKSIFV